MNVTYGKVRLLNDNKLSRQLSIVDAENDNEEETNVQKEEDDLDAVGWILQQL